MGPGYCYFHQEGVKGLKSGTELKFREYEGRVPIRRSLSTWKKEYELYVYTDEVRYKINIDRLRLRDTRDALINCLHSTSCNWPYKLSSQR